MLHWSQSHFLGALGWATLNSFWQMAVLWYVYVAATQLLKLPASKKYVTAVSALLLGFAWFVITAVLYYQNQTTAFAFFQPYIPQSNPVLSTCLLSASVAYLLLLIFPAVRLLKNWQFVRVLQTEGLSKADLHYRLFVRNVAERLGIKRNVKLVMSGIISSPVTVGYLKPMILLPIAAMNNLSTTQVEAVLLHELSHIRRYDYIVNLVVSIIHTLLYFNPFAAFFMRTVEAEREVCCDEVVLQFGYDKLGYASALLHLEKASAKFRLLALAAAGKQNLLTRIEKIVGMEKKRAFRLVQTVPMLAALVCILLFNSVLLIQDAKVGTAIPYTSDAVFMPWQMEQRSKKPLLEPQKQTVAHSKILETATSQIIIDIVNAQSSQPSAANAPATTNPATEMTVPVNFDDVDGNLSKEEKQDVATTLEATKKVVGNLQWKEITTAMGEVLRDDEKAHAEQAYLQELANVNWQNVEQNLKANYEKINWQAIHESMSKALAQIQVDSLQTMYAQALVQLEKAEKEVKSSASVKRNPIPDASLQDMEAARQTLRRNIDSLKLSRPKRVVHL